MCVPGVCTWLLKLYYTSLTLCVLFVSSLEDAPSLPQVVVVPVPVPVFVPIPLHLYTQYAPVPFGIPVPVSTHSPVKYNLTCFFDVKILYLCEDTFPFLKTYLFLVCSHIVII